MRSQLGDTPRAVNLFSWERRKLVGSPVHSAFVQPCITLLSFNHPAANLFAQITCFISRGGTFLNVGFWGPRATNSFRAASICIFPDSSHQEDRIGDGFYLRGQVLS